MPRPESAPTSEILTVPATELARRFVQRTDLYALQRDDGRYACVRNPLTLATIRAHLQGELSLGVYVLDAQSLARYLVLDADNDPDWETLLAVAGDLQRQGAHVYCETSRRGGHCWLFFAQAIPGEAARRFGRGLLHHYGAPQVELFPKQDRLEGGPGSLIRLPFGIHRKSGRRYGFVTPDGKPLAATVRAQIQALAAAQPVPERLLTRFAELAPHTPQTADFEAVETGEGSLSARIKAAVRVRTFVGHIVELADSGVGLCPFHADRRPSFSVNDAENYWHCFACNSGGSVIDFWMRYRDCTFKEAVRELAQMLKL